MEYLKEYTIPNVQEARQLQFKRLFKSQQPEWDDSQILLTKLFDRYTGKKRITVLDFGCGNGNWVIDELRSKITLAVGVDIDKAATSKNQSVDKVLIGDILKLRLPAESFDAIVSLWVFEHVHQPMALIKELARVLKPGGIFAFVTPHKHSALILIRRVFNVVARQLGTSLVSKIYGREAEDIFPTFYEANDRRTIVELAGQAGFEVLELRTNFDPSYTSFGKISYFLTRLSYFVPGSFFKPHLVVILKKK